MRRHPCAVHGLVGNPRATLAARAGARLGNGGIWYAARSTGSRMRREANAGKQSGRTQEIQRLIGRSLRAVVNLEALGENQISLDCDVIQADGGTRTASITGAWVALYLCVEKMKADGLIEGAVMGAGAGDVLSDQIAAISCGIYEGLPVADLDYDEDSVADTDGNFVITGSGAG